MFEIDYIISENRAAVSFPGSEFIYPRAILYSEPFGACIPQALNSKIAAALYGLDGMAHLRSSVLSFALCSPVPHCTVPGMPTGLSAAAG